VAGAPRQSGGRLRTARARPVALEKPLGRGADDRRLCGNNRIPRDRLRLGRRDRVHASAGQETAPRSGLQGLLGMAKYSTSAATSDRSPDAHNARRSRRRAQELDRWEAQNDLKTVSTPSCVHSFGQPMLSKNRCASPSLNGRQSTDY
jgi:hypothetical protein